MYEKKRNTGQYLSFVLAGEIYALDIGMVREVLELQPITRIPRMPEYMQGIINLRGNAVPVFDVRQKFGLGPTEKTVETCIIIVEVTIGEEDLVIGALADSVREVFQLAEDEVLPSPAMGTAIDTSFLKGVGKVSEKFIMLLEVDRIFSEFGDIPVEDFPVSPLGEVQESA